MNRVYIKLLVYNYDASPRHQTIEHNCKSVEHAKRLQSRLESLMGIRYSDNRTGGWLERNHSIYGFIEHIEGIYEETTRRLA